MLCKNMAVHPLFVLKNITAGRVSVAKNVGLC